MLLPTENVGEGSFSQSRHLRKIQMKKRPVGLHVGRSGRKLHKTSPRYVFFVQCNFLPSFLHPKVYIFLIISLRMYCNETIFLFVAVVRASLRISCLPFTYQLSTIPVGCNIIDSAFYKNVYLA